MKLLLDENLPHELRHLLIGHEAFTVTYLGWKGTKNGALLSRAAADGFDALVTVDNGVAYQQNLQTLPIAVIILSAISNDIGDLKPLHRSFWMNCRVSRRGRSCEFHERSLR